MHPKRVFLIVVTAAAIAASGCATIGTMQTANTLGKGKFQASLEPTYWGLVAGSQTGNIFFPNLTLSARYGLSDKVDFGGRIGSNGFEIDTKFMLTDPKKTGFVVSIAPLAGGGAVGGTTGMAGSVYLQVPVLFGFGIGGGSQLVLTPKLLDWYLFGSGSVTGSSGLGQGNILGLGASAGVSLKLANGFRIMPEVAFAYPIVEGASLSSGGTSAGASQVGGSFVLMQFALAFLFGGG